MAQKDRKNRALVTQKQILFGTPFSNVLRDTQKPKPLRFLLDPTLRFVLCPLPFQRPCIFKFGGFQNLMITKPLFIFLIILVKFFLPDHDHPTNGLRQFQEIASYSLPSLVIQDSSVHPRPPYCAHRFLLLKAPYIIMPT